MDTINLRVSGFKGSNLNFVQLCTEFGRGLNAEVIQVAMVSDDAADVMVIRNNSPRSVADALLSWTSPEGQHFNVSYTADEFGFQP
ncbi:chitin-binding domain-containing protein [Pseudomonas sp. P2758]|uniref:chitin-binding domain-containing protein n=1 Tax=Pseudomonas sp. P2758 TaxID=3409916 RepID=UPI003B5A4AA7